MISLKYQDKGTIIHRLHPLTKLAWGSGVLALSLIFNNPLYVSILFLAVLSLILLADIVREWSALIKFSLWLAASIIVINALVSYNGSHVLLEAPFRLPIVGNPVITAEAIAFGGMMALRLLVIISVFTLLNMTIHPDDVMSALLKLRFPYKSVLITSLSTRFVPCLVDDVGRISDGYRTRGLELEKGHLFRRIKGRALVTTPLLANSLDRAVQVAEAMEARAFGAGRGRTFYKETRMTTTDVVMLSASLLPLAWGIFLRLAGYGNYEFFPTLKAITPGLSEILMLALLALSLAAVLPLALVKRRIDLD